MKKLILSLALLAGMSFHAFCQAPETEGQDNEEQTEQVEEAEEAQE